MADRTSIANQALIEIGKGLITSLETGSGERVRLVNAVFDDFLDEELEAEDWKFATYRAQLPALAATPDFGYTYQHRLPANPFCLRVLEEVNDAEYKREGSVLLSDSTPLQIRYIGRITDMNMLSALFRRSFYLRLASHLAVPLVGSVKLRDRLAKEHREAHAKAASKDAQQDTPPVQADGSWLDERL